MSVRKAKGEISRLGQSRGSLKSEKMNESSKSNETLSLCGTVNLFIAFAKQ